MKIVALDIATVTGVCVGSSGADPKFWDVNLGKSPDDRRFSNVLRLAHGLIAAHEPDLIVIEAAIGGKMASAYLIGLVACVRGCAANRGIPVEVVNVASVRKHFLGRAITTADFPAMKKTAAKKAIKQEVIKRCRMLKWDVQSDNEADACALWDYACAHWARGYQSKPLGGLFT